jgi:hypothetical protein
VALDLRAYSGAGHRQRDCHCHLYVAALCGPELLDNGQDAAAVRQEFLTLSQNPQANPARFHNIVDTWWGLSYSTPSIASADWVTVALLVLVMIPFIVVMGLNTPGRWRCSSAAFVMRQRMSPKGNLAVRQSSSRMRRLKWSALRRL